MNGIGVRPNKEKEKKSQYREDLLDQMNGDRDRKLRDKMSSKDGAGTGLDVGNGYKNNRVPSQREVNEFLLNQIAEKEMDKAYKKAVGKFFFHSIFISLQQDDAKMMENLKNQREKEDEVAEFSCVRLSYICLCSS